MSKVDHVTVGGVKVTQELLSRACGYIMAHVSMFSEKYPAGYVPRLSDLNEQDPIRTIEGYAWECFDNPGNMPGFLDAVMGQPRPATARPSGQILEDAGFPRIVASRGLRGLGAVPRKVTEWADAYVGAGTPWLWVVSQHLELGTMMAAHVAVRVARAMDEGRAPGGKISFVRDEDLLGRLDSADIYGEGSRYNTMGGFAACDLLILSIDGEQMSPRHWEMFARLIAHRHDGMLPTVFVCPLRPSEWTHLYARVDGSAALTMRDQIREGLGGYATDGTLEEQTNAHVVRVLPTPHRPLAVGG